jgi:site-specific DNA recombinase
VKGEPGKLEIVEEEAEIVRRIFREYKEGASARQIAIDLNRDHVPPPRAARQSTGSSKDYRFRLHGSSRSIPSAAIFPSALRAQRLTAARR